MKLAVDARQMYRANRRGIGKTMVALYGQVAALRADWRIVMFHRNRDVVNPFSEYPHVETRLIEMPGDRWNLWEHVRLPMAARGCSADLLHCPANTAPRMGKVPVVVTIHDLIPLEGRVTSADRAWGRNVARAASKARLVLTPSRHSRDRLVEGFGIAPVKIHVLPWGVDEAYFQSPSPNARDELVARYGLDASKQWVFGFGAADPRKNTRRILQAWDSLPDILLENWQLVLVGIQEAVIEEYRRLVRSQRSSSAVTLLPFIPEEDLHRFLSTSDLLCYPSMSEGFGLPVLEAFAAGTAVVTSNRTSLPEVAGQAAELVDPESVEDIRRGLEVLMSDPHRREELVQIGRERARDFTWRGCAERFIALLEQIHSG